MFFQKLKINNFLRLIFLIIFGFLVVKINFAESDCPQKTTAGNGYIIFVGEVISMGNDKEVKGWFEYGESVDNLISTPKLTLYKEGIYCLKVEGLKDCQEYFYRAAVSNQAGKSYGEIKKIKTLCSKNLLDKEKNQQDNKNNSIDILLENFYEVKKCSFSHLKFTLINNTSFKKKTFLNVEGEIKSWFDPQEKEFILRPHEKLTDNWKIYVPCNLKENKYQAMLILKTNDFYKQNSIVLEIKSYEVNNLLSAFIGLFFDNFSKLLIFVLLIVILILIFINAKLRKEEVDIDSQVIK